jgi:hypothetical protein
MRCARSALGWLVGLMLASHVLFWVGLECGLDALRDPEYGVRLRFLQRAVAARPGRPLVLVLGSSRVAMGVCPAVLPDGQFDPLVFNAGRMGAGPVHQQLMLKRYLKAGVRPEAALLEIWPEFFTGSELDRIEPQRLRLAELADLSRHGDDATKVRRQCWQAHFAPWADFRVELMYHLLPGWTPHTDRARRQPLGWTWMLIDPWGWKALDDRTMLGRPRAEVIERARSLHGPPLQDLPLSPAVVSDYRDLLAFCRQQSLRTALLYQPESSEFRALYGPKTWGRFQELVAGLHREFGVELIDGRCAAADDDLPDGHHLTPDGAARYTRWLGREAIPSWLRCQPRTAE